MNQAKQFNRLGLLMLALLSSVLVWGNDFDKAEAWLKDNQPIDLDKQCSVLSGGATKLACHLIEFSDDALLVGNTGKAVLEAEAKTIDALAAAGVLVPEHGDIFNLKSFSKNKKLPEKSYPSMLETWVNGAEIANNLRDFNSPPKDFWQTSFGKAAAGVGVNAGQLQSKAVPNLQAYLDFVNSKDKYVVDVEMFVTASGQVYLVDLAGGFGSRSTRVATWKTQLTNAINAINGL